MSTDDTRRDESEEDESGTPSFPAGTFRARADWESVSLGWNKDHTSELISVRLRVTDPLFPLVIGKGITWYGKFATQDNERFALKGLRAMGWDSGPLGKPGGEDGALGGLGGNDCEIVVIHRTWGTPPKTRAEVQYVNEIGGMGFKETLDQGALAKLNARVLRGQPAAQPARPATQYAGRQNANPPPRAAQQPNPASRAVQPPASVTPIRSQGITPERLRHLAEHPARAQHTTVRVDPNAPATQPITTQEDEDRARLARIDRGDDIRTPEEVADDEIQY